MLTEELYEACKRCFTGGAPFSSAEVVRLNKVKRICDKFLAEYNGRVDIDLSALSNVTIIEMGFLHGCKKLTNIDLSALSNVTKIGSYFLNCDICSVTNEWLFTRKRYVCLPYNRKGLKILEPKLLPGSTSRHLDKIK